MTRFKARGVVRIIGGRWKRTPLTVADTEGLRPTPDRVRETLFNWLSNEFDQSLEGLSFLDLFAGTGALGLEAASRGAANVLLVERNPTVAKILGGQVDKLGAGDRVTVLRSDALTVVDQLRREGKSFDVVLLDPPFADGSLMQIVAAAAAVSANLIYVETSRALEGDPLDALGLTMRRSAQAGAVFYHLLRRKNNEETVDASSDLSGDIRSADARS